MSAVKASRKRCERNQAHAGAEERLRRLEQRLAIEHAVTRILEQSGTLAEAAPQIIRVFCELLQWPCGARWELDPGSNALRCRETWGVRTTDIDQFLEATRQLSPSTQPSGLIGQVWTQAQPMWIRELVQEPTFRRAPAALKAGLLSALAFPIKAGELVLGVMEFFSRDNQEPDPDLLDCTAYVGNQIGQFYERGRAQEELHRFRAAMDASADMIVLIDRATMRFVDVNLTACRLLGYSREELLTMGPQDVLPESREELERAYDEFISNPSNVTGMRSCYRCKNGTTIPFESTRRVLRSGDSYIIAAISRDIRERIAAEAALRESNERFRALTQLSSDWYWEQDAEFRFTRFEGQRVANPDKGMVAGFMGKRRWELDHEVEGGWDAHRALLEAHQPFRDVVINSPLPDGGRRYVSISGEPMYAADGRFMGYRGVGQDITERKRDEERIRYLAHHDGLTALPNRAMFGEVLTLSIQQARRYGRGFAVLFIDLDRFKVINDTFGHEAGDKLLQEIGARLRDCVRASDSVARLGGDEFVILVSEITEKSQIASVARKILSTTIKPIVIMGQECRVTASIGIAMYPADASDEAALMKNADIAMYRAKEDGKNNFHFYSEKINVHSLERVALETALRRALERDEFLLHYQAKRALKTGEITGVEALLRWRHPDLGMVSPAQFIPLAEETGLIVPIGRWVLKTACAQNVAWQRAGLPSVRMSVNLSGRQFGDEDLLRDVAASLDESGMAPDLLELELTESMVMQDHERTLRLLSAMKQIGVRLAIDDFGVGYSSLAQIKRFPIDTLKVDRSFIRELPQDPEDQAITQAIIAMGKTLSLTVVAEGVETLEQEQFLREHACDEMQGYYFSKPIAPDQFAELLRTHFAAAKALP